MTEPKFTPNQWRRRRQIIYGSLIFSAAAMGRVIFFPAPEFLVNAVLLYMSGLAMGVIGSYVFGAVWDDLNVRKTSDAG